jgi:hypothetical protein
MIGRILSVLAIALVAGRAAPADAANAPKSTTTTPSPATPTMTAQVANILRGREVTLRGSSYTAKPLTCYSAQNAQRERCAVRVTESTNQAAEDYLQIFVAEDGDEFERDREAIDAIAKKPRWLISQDDPVSLTIKAAEHDMLLESHCAQGLGQENTYAYCAIAIGAHVVVESQVSPHALSTNSVAAGLRGNADDLERARKLALAGAFFVSDVLTDLLTPELRSAQ